MLSASRKPSGRFLMVSIVDIIQRLFTISVVGCFMASVVAGNLIYVFRRWFFNGFRRGREHFFNGLRACNSKRNNFRFVTNSRLRWGHGRAVIMTSPCAAQRPRILT